MSKPDTCKYCVSVYVREIRFDDAQVKATNRYGEYFCSDCERQLGWMPFPSQPMPTVHPPFDGFFAQFTGTPAQQNGARSLRKQLMIQYRERGPEPWPEALAVFRSIHDATWFLANARRARADIRWPRLDQLDPKCLM
jgi:hypothetical protein